LRVKGTMMTMWLALVQAPRPLCPPRLTHLGETLAIAGHAFSALETEMGRERLLRGRRCYDTKCITCFGTGVIHDR
jgi:hypothetical protein